MRAVKKIKFFPTVTTKLGTVCRKFQFRRSILIFFKTEIPSEKKKIFTEGRLKDL